MNRGKVPHVEQDKQHAVGICLCSTARMYTGVECMELCYNKENLKMMPISSVI